MVNSLTGLSAMSDRVLVGPQTADDAGVFAFDGTALVATADFITPVCDDPYRYGRVAAANSMSDVFAMGGEVLFALNLCCFPEDKAPAEVFTAILQGAVDAVRDAGGAILGGHSVGDPELKFGLAVIGKADPERILTNAGAEPGQRLVLTKPLGSGVLLNAFRPGKIDEAALEPIMVSMERLNDKAARAALAHGATGCTDITGFGLVGHALEVARASNVEIRLRFDTACRSTPASTRWWRPVSRPAARRTIEPRRVTPSKIVASLDAPREELLFDPQTSGGLLIAVPAESAEALVATLREGGDPAVDVGEVVEGPPKVVIT